MKLSYLFSIPSLILSATTLSAVAALPSPSVGEEQGDIVLTCDSVFSHIDSNLYAVKEEMPVYAEEFYVGDANPAGYNVEICYPEFKELSGKELRALRKLQQSGSVATDTAIERGGNVLSPCPAPVYGLDLQQSLSFSRKKGYLLVNFNPIVRHDGKWKRILSCQIKVSERTTATADNTNATTDNTSAMPHKAPAAITPADRWSTTSVLSSGKWAKVRVSKEGIYQLTASDIQKMGFSQLSKVKIYGYGGLLQDEKLNFPQADDAQLITTAPDDLVEVPAMATSDGRLLFWAEGLIRYNWDANNRSYTHVQNHYSQYSYYFVTENDEPATRVASLTEEPAAENTLTDIPYLAVLDNDATSWYSGGRRMFDAYNFSNGNSHAYKLDTPSADETAANSVTVSFGAASTIESTSVAIALNSKNLGTMTIGKFDASDASANVQTTTLSQTGNINGTTSNIFQLTTNKSNSAALDYIRINYRRHLEVKGTPYSFSPQETTPVNLQIGEASNHTHLWRIGQFGSPTAEVPLTLNGNQATASIATPKRRFVFFNDNATYSAPEYVGSVANQNLHADTDVDYVIIIPANGVLESEATRLGELHAKEEGLTYRVVRADQLYNEFSSGTPDASAYRRYLKMLYDRAGSDEEAMPKYCLLMGKSPWDTRLISEHWKGKNANDYLLAFEVDSEAKKVGSVYCYVTDDFFSFLDDGEGGTTLTAGKPDIAMGRMACLTAADAKRLVDKVETYMNNKDAGSWKNTIAILGDNGDENGHMKNAEDIATVVKRYAPNANIQKVYWDRYVWTSTATGYRFPQATAQIKKLMQEGTLLFNYSGHGSPTIISHTKVLDINNFKEALSPYMSLWVLASCEIFPYDSEEESLAEASLYAENGGSIAFMCATRAVYASRNVELNKRYCRYVMERNQHGQLNTMAEALRLTKVNMVESSIADKNNLKYVFFGDPALKLALPTGKIVVDKINDKDISAAGPLERLAAGSVVTFDGHVCMLDDSGEIDPTFDGIVSATLFDSEQTIVCKDNAKNNNAAPMQYKERSKSVFKGSTQAKEGKFRFTIIIPRDISYSDLAARLSLYAVSNDKKHEYNGMSERFCLNGTAEGADQDKEGPKVVAYINSIENPDYTITDENPVLIADISDEYGINNAGISLGHDIELILDDNTAEYTNLNSYFSYDFGSYQKGQLVYPMSGISHGAHTAQLRVWDVNNNVTVTDVHFIVRGQNATGGKDGYITATQNPATTGTRFITYFPEDVSLDGLVTYEVYDTRGRCVYKETASAQTDLSSTTFEWDLRSMDGSLLPGGIYFYRAVFATSDGVKKTDAQKLIILRQ